MVCGLDVIAGRRILFKAENGGLVSTLTYSTAAQTVDMDAYMQYAEGGPNPPDGRFTYTLTGDKDGLGAATAEDGESLIIPANAGVTENGCTLTFTAHEKEPFIMPLSLFSSDGFGIDDVELTVKKFIEKATPVITVKPEATAINYGASLDVSKLEGGTANHPTTGAEISGTFAREPLVGIPTVNEAAIAGCPVTFIPSDTINYNTVTTTVTLTVNKTAPAEVVPPQPIDSEYNGMAEPLIVEGSASGGTMKYWASDDPDAEPPADNSEYSSTIPTRTNAGSYTVWYKVLGDENHEDTQPAKVTALITKKPLELTEQHFTYNGGKAFTVALAGVETDGEESARTVIAYLTAGSVNAGKYTYTAADEPDKDEYSVLLSNSNYVVEQGAGQLVVDPIPVVLRWEGQLVIAYDSEEHTAEATVVNALEDEQVAPLKHENNKAAAIGGYTAKVTELDNGSCTLEGGQNVQQPWRIYEDGEYITLTADPDCTDSADVKPDDEPSAITANNVTLSGMQSGNYLLTDTALTIKGKLQPKPIKLEWRCSTGLVYSGSKANVNATARELLPWDEGLITVTVSGGNEVSAGEGYCAYAVGLTNPDLSPNYNYVLPDDEDMKKCEYSIAPADLYISERTVSLNNDKWTFTEAGVPLEEGNEEVEVTLYPSSHDAGNYAYSADGTAYNTYTAGTANGNYIIKGGAVLIIEKDEPDYTPPVPQTKTYNGEEQELVLSGTAVGGEMQYRLSQDGPYFPAIPAASQVANIRSGTW